MEVIANLQKTMEALNAKLDNDGSNTLVTTNSYWKHAKTGQSPRNNKKTHQEFSSNSESNQEMAKAPDPNDPSNPLLIDNTETSMDAGAGNIIGGIQDEDITKAMVQNYDEHKTNTNYLLEPISHAADQEDNDLWS